MRRLIALLIIAAALIAPGIVGARGRPSVRHKEGGASSPWSYPWRFAYCSDVHLGWTFGGTTIRTTYNFGKFIDTLNAIKKYAPGGLDFMVLGGDYAEDALRSTTLYGPTAIESLAACQSRTLIPWWPVVGNHELVINIDDPAENDTISYEPTIRAINRFPAFFYARHPYYSKTWKNLDFMALNNCVNYDVASNLDYLANNPFGNGAEVPGLDFYGMAATSGTERTAMRTFLANRSKARWLIVAQHRANYGSDANSSNRYNWNSGPLRSTGYIKEIEDSLKTDERGIILFGDQHLPLWFTRAMRDSAVASGTGKGLYHIGVSGSGGARPADSTEAISGAWLQACLFGASGGVTALRGHTSTAWSDTLSAKSDRDAMRTWTWQLYTVYADVIEVETFRVYTSLSSGSGYYTGAGSNRLIDRRTITRDTQ